MVAEAWRAWQRRLHWAVAGLVFGNLALGLAMEAVPLSLLLVKFLSYQLHKSLGLLVLGLTLWRLGLRGVVGRPAAVGGWAAALGQGVLYSLLIGVPVLGWMTAAAAPGDVPTWFFLLLRVPGPFGSDAGLYAVLWPAHLWAAVVLGVLAVGHAGMAVRHGGAVLRGMWVGK